MLVIYIITTTFVVPIERDDSNHTKNSKSPKVDLHIFRNNCYVMLYFFSFSQSLNVYKCRSKDQ